MRICQVISSNLPILDAGERRWGAVELIMGEYVKNLREQGHHVDLKYLNDVIPSEYDIIHIHVANLCIEAKQIGIPYVYSIHDHHSYHFGKDSRNYKEQLEAIQGSIFSICHAEFLLDWFDTQKLFYLRHGVDTTIYKPYIKTTLGYHYPAKHRLLMCGNNGLGGDYSVDRKGFAIGIEAARIVGLPITIVGGDGTKKFFEARPDLLQPHVTLYDNDPIESEKIEIFKQHTIFLHPSTLEFGHPNLTLCEMSAMAIPMVATYKGSQDISGLFRLIEPTVENTVNGIQEIVKYYSDYRMDMFERALDLAWPKAISNLEQMYQAILTQKQGLFDSETVKKQYVKAYV
jgi:glycosyltransferase involved in cell wall biosynthesis